jgi:hypothetical protein
MSVDRLNNLYLEAPCQAHAVAIFTNAGAFAQVDYSGGPIGGE